MPAPSVFLLIFEEVACAVQAEVWGRVLGAEEHAHASAFRRIEDRTRYRAAHALLRVTLGAAIGSPPASLRFRRTAEGKPTLAEPQGPQFNLTHTDGLVACALHDEPVGLDAELGRRKVEDATFTMLAPFEQAWLRRIPVGIQRDEAFIRLWVAKEAFVKCLGLGLLLDPTRYALDLGGDQIRLHQVPPEVGPGPWEIDFLDAGPRHVSAVATGGGTRSRPLPRHVSADELTRICQA